MPPTTLPPTEAPTTLPPTTLPPTEAPTTEVPTTEVPTTEVPTTEVPTTAAPTVLPTEEPTDAPTTAAPTTAAPTVGPTPYSCEEGTVLVSASLVSSGDNTDISSDARVTFFYSVDESETDIILDSLTPYNWKCIESKLLTLVVEGDLSNYKLKISSSSTPEEELDLNTYNNNYYYHPSVGWIQETTMISCELPTDMKAEVRVLRITSGACSHPGSLDESFNPHFDGTPIDFSEFTNLIYLNVEDDNQFQAQNEFELTGLNYLEGVKIGQNCFNYQKSTTPKKRYNKRVFSITNCPKLTEISIGNYSFSDFSGGFTLNSLPSLVNLYIGQLGKPSFNFYRASNFRLQCTLESIVIRCRFGFSAVCGVR